MKRYQQSIKKHSKNIQKHEKTLNNTEKINFVKIDFACTVFFILYLNMLFIFLGLYVEIGFITKFCIEFSKIVLDR